MHSANQITDKPDFLAPHSGSFEEGMNDVDRTTYVSYVAKRKEQEAVEAQSIEDFMRDFGATAAPGNNAKSIGDLYHAKKTNEMSVKKCILHTSGKTISLALNTDA